MTNIDKGIRPEGTPKVKPGRKITNYDNFWKKFSIKTAGRPNKKAPGTNRKKCGCGKYYATKKTLKTHIEAMHNGVPPLGTSKSINDV